MKVLYAIQGTGNGHLGRAMEIAPHLMKRMDVDFLISGLTAELKFPYKFKYNCHGVSFFFGKNGGIDYLKSFRYVKPLRAWKDIRAIPVQNYDVIINDFEPITAHAAKRKSIPVIAVSHQAAFFSEKVPLPEKRSKFFEYGMKKLFAPADDYVGLHYRPYDDQVLPPIIRKEITCGKISNSGHITVYLPAYADEILVQQFNKLQDVSFEVFSKKTKKENQVGNTLLHPVSKSAYTKSLLGCLGLVTGGGFQSTSEALYLKKKLLVLPMWDQYEQRCNAVALEEMGVAITKKVDTDFYQTLSQWISSNQNVDYFEYEPDTSRVAEKVHELALKLVAMN